MMRVSELLRKLHGAHPDARVVITPHQDHLMSSSTIIWTGDISSVYIDEDGVPELVVTFGKDVPKAPYLELPEELHDSDEERNGAWCDRCGIHHSGSCSDEDLEDLDEELHEHFDDLSLGHLPEDDGIPVQRRIAVREGD